MNEFVVILVLDLLTPYSCIEISKAELKYVNFELLSHSLQVE